MRVTRVNVRNTHVVRVNPISTTRDVFVGTRAEENGPDFRGVRLVRTAGTRPVARRRRPFMFPFKQARSDDRRDRRIRRGQFRRSKRKRFRAYVYTHFKNASMCVTPVSAR